MKIYTRTLLRLVPVVLAVHTIGVSAATPKPSGSAAGDTASQDARTILEQAKARAAAEHKEILLVFSASWCGPCHRLQRFMEEGAVRPILEKAFVTARLDAGEMPGDNRHANTPGAEKLQSAMGGGDAGFPFVVMLNAEGKPITTALRPVEGSDSDRNIGYPTKPEEIEWFMQMLHQAAPSLSEKEKAKVRRWLDDHARS